MTTPSIRALCLSLCLTLTACGGSDDETSPSPSATQDAVVVDAGALEDTTSADAAAEDAAGVDATPKGDSAEQDAKSNDDAANDAASSDASSSDGGATVDAGAKGCTPACSLTQKCEAGKCVDVPQPCGGPCALDAYCDSATNTCTPSACSLPTTFSDSVQKVSFLQIATTDQGCDLTGNGASDNVFGKILKVYADANTELLKSVQSGLFILLLEGDGYDTSGKAFKVNGYLGELDPSNSDCPVTASFGDCKYTVDSDNFAGGPAGSVCKPQVQVTPATINSGLLKAGGAIEQTLTLMLPVVGGLPVKISGVSIKGSTSGPTKWSDTKKGKICGVMTTQDFKKAIDAVPEESWKEINLDKSTVQQVLEVFLAPDIDLNADGTPDAISMALDFESVKGSIVKVIP